MIARTLAPNGLTKEEVLADISSVLNESYLKKQEFKKQLTKRYSDSSDLGYFFDILYDDFGSYPLEDKTHEILFHEARLIAKKISSFSSTTSLPKKDLIHKIFRNTENTLGVNRIVIELNELNFFETLGDFDDCLNVMCRHASHTLYSETKTILSKKITSLMRNDLDLAERYLYKFSQTLEEELTIEAQSLLLTLIKTICKIPTIPNLLKARNLAHGNLPKKLQDQFNKLEAKCAKRWYKSVISNSRLEEKFVRYPLWEDDSKLNPAHANALVNSIKENSINPWVIKTLADSSASNDQIVNQLVIAFVENDLFLNIRSLQSLRSIANTGHENSYKRALKCINQKMHDFIIGRIQKCTSSIEVLSVFIIIQDDLSDEFELIFSILREVCTKLTKLNHGPKAIIRFIQRLMDRDTTNGALLAIHFLIECKVPSLTLLTRFDISRMRNAIQNYPTFNNHRTLSCEELVGNQILQNDLLDPINSFETLSDCVKTELIPEKLQDNFKLVVAHKLAKLVTYRPITIEVNELEHALQLHSWLDIDNPKLHASVSSIYQAKVHEESLSSTKKGIPLTQFYYEEFDSISRGSRGFGRRFDGRFSTVFEKGVIQAVLQELLSGKMNTLEFTELIHLLNNDGIATDSMLVDFFESNILYDHDIALKLQKATSNYPLRIHSNTMLTQALSSTTSFSARQPLGNLLQLLKDWGPNVNPNINAAVKRQVHLLAKMNLDDETLLIVGNMSGIKLDNKLKRRHKIISEQRAIKKRIESLGDIDEVISYASNINWDGPQWKYEVRLFAKKTKNVLSDAEQLGPLLSVLASKCDEKKINFALCELAEVLPPSLSILDLEQFWFYRTVNVRSEESLHKILVKKLLHNWATALADYDLNHIYKDIRRNEVSFVTIDSVGNIIQKHYLQKARKYSSLDMFLQEVKHTSSTTAMIQIGLELVERWPLADVCFAFRNACLNNELSQKQKATFAKVLHLKKSELVDCNTNELNTIFLVLKNLPADNEDVIVFANAWADAYLDVGINLHQIASMCSYSPEYGVDILLRNYLERKPLLNNQQKKLLEESVWKDDSDIFSFRDIRKLLK